MTKRRYFFDVETDNLLVKATKIWCAVAIDLDTGEELLFKRDQLAEFARLLEEATMLIGHNIVGFDIPVCNRLLGIDIKAKAFDTIIISRMMFPDRFNKRAPINLSHSLAAWGTALGFPKIDFIGMMRDRAIERSEKKEFADIIKWAKKNPFSGPPNDTVSEEEYLSEMLDYCIQDVRVNVKVYEKQVNWAEANAKPVQMEHIASKICATMVENGWGYDSKAGDSLEQKLTADKAASLDILQSAFPDIVEDRGLGKRGQKLKDKVTSFNPGSHPQVYQRLNDKYNGKFVTTMTDLGSPQCDAESLKPYINSMPEVKEILAYRDIDKLIGQVKKWNLLAWEDGGDGRIHGGINVQGAATGRCTHAGPNMAQVSSEHRARSLWTPVNATDVVLGADLSGLELRMLAHYMAKWDDGAYADLILNGDIHTANQKAAGLETRDQAKTFIYGFLYGAGDGKIGEIVGGSKAQGKRLKAQFLENLPALSKLIDTVKQEAENNRGAVVLPDGRRVPVRSEHAALNTLLQGAGAIVSKYWMVVANSNLTKAYGPNVVKQMAYVHDELQFSCPKDIAEEAGQMVIDSAIEAGERLGILMPTSAEYQIGATWADTH